MKKETYRQHWDFEGNIFFISESSNKIVESIPQDYRPVKKQSGKIIWVSEEDSIKAS